MDYSKEVVDFQLTVIEKLVLDVTPDKVIEKASDLVSMAMGKDMTGAEKFAWVVEQVKPLLDGLFKLLVEFLVQLIYDMAMGYKENLINGN